VLLICIIQDSVIQCLIMMRMCQLRCAVVEVVSWFSQLGERRCR